MCRAISIYISREMYTHRGCMRLCNIGIYLYIAPTCPYTTISIYRYMLRKVYMYRKRDPFVYKCAESDLFLHDKGMYMCRAKVMCIERYVYMFLGTCICIQSLLYMDMWVRCMSIYLYPQATIYIYIHTDTLIPCTYTSL